MALSWTNFTNNSTLGSIRESLNTFLTSVKNTVNNNINDIINVNTLVSNLTESLNLLTTRTTTAEANINGIKANVNYLLAKDTYDYIQDTDVTVDTTEYVEVLRLSTPIRVSGTYRLEMSLFYSLDSITSSAYFRFSVDGGSTWVETEREPRANTNTIPLMYATTIVHTEGIFDCRIEAKKELAGDTLLIKNIEAMFDKRGK